MANLREAEVSIGNLERLELPKGMEVVMPMGAALFFSRFDRKINLRKEVAQNPALLEQALERRKLYERMGEIFDQVTDVRMDFDDAVDKGLVSRECVDHLYSGLSDFINKDPNNSRILLYLPSQLLPDVRRVGASDQAKGFARVCRDSWIRLLFYSEARANYVDGDVLEPQIGKPERIRKAGHLTADLIAKGIVDQKDVVKLIQISNENELLRSLMEGAIVAREKGLIDDDLWMEVCDISGTKRVMLDVLQKGSWSVEDIQREVVAGEGKSWLDIVAKKLQRKLFAIEMKYREGGSYDLSFSKKRLRWEKGVKRNEAIDNVCEMTSEKLLKREVEIGDLRKLTAESEEEAVKIMGLRTVVRVAEKIAIDDKGSAEVFAKENWELFDGLWNTGSPEVKEAVVAAVSRLWHLGVIGQDFFERYGITLPDFSLPFPIDLRKLMEGDGKVLANATVKMSEDDYLSKYIFPVILLCGSKVKGYNGMKADSDVVIFFRPGVDFDRKEEVLKRIGVVVPEIDDPEALLQYWVTEGDAKLGLAVTPDNIRYALGPEDGNFMMEGVWIGKGEDIKRISCDIFEKYFDLRRFGEQKGQAREELLIQIEESVLQYRLMHKGYRKYYPNLRGDGSQHSGLIDWNSDYWDPGYRRVASQLFLARVFLPDLEIS